MAATQTVAQLPMLRKSNQHSSKLEPRHGVITLSGYGIVVRVDRGHLVLEDGVGADRSSCRLPRVGHGLKRLVVIGADGNISLAALRWLADQKSSFVSHSISRAWDLTFQLLGANTKVDFQSVSGHIATGKGASTQTHIGPG